MASDTTSLDAIDALVRQLALVFGLAVGLGALALVLVSLWDRRQDHDVVADWAIQNGYELLGVSRRRWWNQGRFTWSTGSAKRVYHVTVEDAAGHRRSGLLRFGPRASGLDDDVYVFNAFSEVDVAWDDDHKVVSMPFRHLSDAEAAALRRADPSLRSAGDRHRR